MRELCLGEAREATPLRILRGGRQSDDLGDHDAPLHAKIFCQTQCWRTGIMDRSRFGTGGQAHASSALGCRSDKYVPVEWADAFREIGTELQKIEPKAAVFYSSGRASLEASYMYALFARLFGNNNLPDSSNMCHESTSVGLPLSIGVPVGTVTLADFASTDCILFFGHNTGVNSPRMLHDLQECAQRGVPIIVFNPLRERGFERFTNPQSPVEMLSGVDADKFAIPSDQGRRRQGGADGMCKALLALDAGAKAAGRERILDLRVHRRTHPRLCGIRSGGARG